MNIKFLVLVFIGIFFSCLGLSKLANFYFDISSDYLTATATFFAAFVALYLFNDWREEFLVLKIPELHTLLVKHSEEISKNLIDSKFNFHNVISGKDEQQIKDSFAKTRNESIAASSKLNEIIKVFECLEKSCASELKKDIKNHQRDAKELSNMIFQFYFDSNKGVGLPIDNNTINHWEELDKTIRSINHNLVKFN